MIAKSLIFILLLILLPDIYLYCRYLRRCRWWIVLLWFLPTVLFMVATLLLARSRDFVPDDMTWLNVYLFLLGLIPVAKLVFSLASLCGRHGWKIGIAAVVVVWSVLFYGTFVGPRQLDIRHVEIAFSDLPEAFDGYRIVHFTDAHVGSSSMAFVDRLVDSINAQGADMVAFTGDMQNKDPREVTPYIGAFSRIKAKDGVYAVQGNHDYPMYIDAPYYVKAENEERLIGAEQEMGWTVLSNSHRFIRRDGDSMVIAGMQNDGEGRFPQKGNIGTALWGVLRTQFVVMLEHDPSAWRRKILTHSHAQLTLSGHTHGAQFELFGWSPLSLFQKECSGLYRQGERSLYVSKGVGALIPFRFCCNPEIVVITLHRKTQ